MGGEGKRRIKNTSQVFGASYSVDMISFAQIIGARKEKKS